jgi:hypothetical protein
VIESASEPRAACSDISLSFSQLVRPILPAQKLNDRVGACHSTK